MPSFFLELVVGRVVRTMAKTVLCNKNTLEARLSRRAFLNTAAAASLTLAVPVSAHAALRRLVRPVRIGVIADLHHDVMHDGPDRLAAFIADPLVRDSNAILQLGDFAYPAPRNSEILKQFNGAHARPLHVIGNHDTDGGFLEGGLHQDLGDAEPLLRNES